MIFGGTVLREGEQLADCIKRADGKLYDGKAGGRNQVVTA